MDDKDRGLINALSQGLPLSLTPFEDLARSFHLSEAEVMGKIRAYKRSGIIRRFGATLRHTKAGVMANAMSVWVVPKERVDEVGSLIASYKQVTHCYERQTHPLWRYNLYAMIHGRSKRECEKVAREISEKSRIREYKLLYSTEELKKTTMEYFKDGFSKGKKPVKC